MKMKMPLVSALLAVTAFYAMPVATAAGSSSSGTLLTHQVVDDAKSRVLGTVKEKSDKELTLTLIKDGSESKVTLTSETRYLKDRMPATFEDVKVGVTVRVELKDDSRDAIIVNILNLKL